MTPRRRGPLAGALAWGMGLGWALASIRPAHAEEGLRFRDPGGWAPSDRAIVEEAFASAPVALQTRVTVTRGPAPTPPALLREPHTLVEWRGGELRLAVDGLGAAAASWNAGQDEDPIDVRTLLRRAVLHGLAHVADRRAGWSSTARWRDLSGWGPFGGTAAEHEPGAFVTAAAMGSPGEDLASTITSVLDAAERPPPDADTDPRCRLPSKVRFIGDILGPLPMRDCPRLADLGLDPAGIAEIELVYVAGSATSIASIAGHLFVMLATTPNADGIVYQNSYALVANTTGPLTLQTVFQGLVGGLPSVILQRPYELTLQSYAQTDNRDVRRYALKLDARQKERLLHRLDELRQGWERPYAFLTRNCTALGVDLIRAALDGDFHPPAPLSPETFFGMLDRRGLLDAVPTDRADALAVGSRALAADRRRFEAAQELARRDPTLEAPLGEALAPTGKRRSGGYAALARHPGAPLDTLLALDQFLAWSDSVEQGVATRKRSERGLSQLEGSTSASLRAAKATVRTRALAQGASYGSFQPGEAEVLAAAATPRDQMGTHATLSGVRVWGELGPDWVGWVGASTALFDSRVGEPRRYAPGANAGYTLFDTGVAVSTEGQLRLKGELAGTESLTPTRGPFATGYYGNLGVTEVWEPLSGHLDMRWLEAGGLLALWRGQEGGLLAWVSGGLALDTRGEEDTAVGERVGVEAPIGLLVRADSAREALTGLGLSLRWAPRLSAAGVVSARSTASVEGRVRLGEAFGSDVGLTLDGTLVGDGLGGPTKLAPALQVGLRVERF